MPEPTLPAAAQDTPGPPAEAPAHDLAYPPAGRAACQHYAYAPVCPGSGRPWTRCGPDEAPCCPSCGAGTDRISYDPSYHLAAVPAHVPGALPVRLVHAADWAERVAPAGPDAGDFLIANAPRPLAGPLTWVGEFRAGVFYSAMAAAEAPFESWRRDDASLIAFVTQPRVEAAAREHAAGYGYAGDAAIAADGLTLADFADGLRLPWRGGDSWGTAGHPDATPAGGTDD